MKNTLSAISKGVNTNILTPTPINTNTNHGTASTIIANCASNSIVSNRFNGNVSNGNLNCSLAKGNGLGNSSQMVSSGTLLHHHVNVTPVPSPSSSASAASASATPPHLSSASTSPSMALPPPPSTPSILQSQPHSPHQHQRFHARQSSHQTTNTASNPNAMLQPEPQLTSQSSCHSHSQSQCPLHHHSAQQQQQAQHQHQLGHTHAIPQPQPQPQSQPHQHQHQHPHQQHPVAHHHPHGHAHHSLSSISLSPLLGSDQIVGKVFRVRSKIGSGSFGEIYHGTHMQTHSNVAIKVERQDSKYPQLLEEYKVYNSIRPAKGFPQVYWYGTFGSLNVLVMDLLGPSLETLYHKCGRKFSIKTVALLALQLLERIEHQHSHCYLHRDVKPDNFLLGRNSDSRLVYVIDMGLAKQYRDPRSMQHIPKKDNKKLIGTPRYASINTHLGLEQCRRDDLESIGYMLLYFALGRLPWQGLKAKTKQEKYDKISERKKSIPIQDLCASLPDEFCRYLGYVRSLRFEEEPDYAYLRGLFQQLLARNGWREDDPFDWQLLKKEDMHLVQNQSHNVQDIQFVVRQMNPPNSQYINPLLTRNHCANTNNAPIFSGGPPPNLSVFKPLSVEANANNGNGNANATCTAVAVKSCKKKTDRQTHQRNCSNMAVQLFTISNQPQAAGTAALRNTRMQSSTSGTPMASTPSLASSTLPLPIPPTSSASLPLMLTSGLPPQFQMQFPASSNSQTAQQFIFGRPLNNGTLNSNGANTTMTNSNNQKTAILSPRPQGMANKPEGSSSSAQQMQHVSPLQIAVTNSPSQLQHNITHSHGQDLYAAQDPSTSGLAINAMQRTTTDVSACLSDVLTPSNVPKGSMQSVSQDELFHAFESVENERDLLRKRVNKYEHLLHGYRYEVSRMKEHIAKFAPPYNFCHPLIISQFGLATHGPVQMAEVEPTNPLLASRAVSAATVNVSLDTNEMLPSLASASLPPSAAASAAVALSKGIIRHPPPTSHLSHSSSSRVGSPALALASPSVESSSSPVQSPPISPNPLQANNSAAASAVLSPSMLQRNQSHSPLLTAHSLKRKTPNSSLFGSAADGHTNGPHLCASNSASSLKRMRTSLMSAAAFSGEDEDDDERKMAVANGDGDESNVLQHHINEIATL